MSFKDSLPYIIAIVTAICSWVGSYIMSSKRARQDIAKLKLELEIMEKEQIHKLDILQKELENELIRKEKDMEDNSKYGSMKDIVGGLMGGLVNSAFSTPEMQEELAKQIKEGFKKE